jgi:hypothetical protein
MLRNIIDVKVIRWAVHVIRIEETINTNFGRTTEELEPIGRLRFEDNIYKEIGGRSVEWTHLAQDRNQWRIILNMVINLSVPKNAKDFWTS